MAVPALLTVLPIGLLSCLAVKSSTLSGPSGSWQSCCGCSQPDFWTVGLVFRSSSTASRNSCVCADETEAGEHRAEHPPPTTTIVSGRIISRSIHPARPGRPAAMSAATEEEAAAGAGAYDRLREHKAFDDTKAGVKGLVDAGVTTVPAIFHHHHQVSSASTTTTPPPPPPPAITIPVIDLSADADARTRGELIAQVNAAASTAGFFHLVNHGVPGELLAETLASVRRFHESPAAAKRPYYTRDPRRRLRFNSNFDLFRSPAANWRDTLFLQAAPGPAPRPEDLPPAVRRALPEYAAAAGAVAARVLALLSEALGLPPGRLAGDRCADGLSVVCNYYPPCPETERTLGCSAHSDPSFLTVLLVQDAGHGGGGLQARIGGGWVDVAPVAGGLVVNVGDLLQLVSNGRFRSVAHRVVANRSKDTARVSVACFCNADIARSTRLYGPIAELVSGGDGGGGERAVYRSVTVPEFLAYYDEKGLDGRPALEHFRLH